MSDNHFASTHRWDRTYHLSYLILAWVAVLVGFAPSVMSRYAGQADYPAPLILELHVFTFTGWLCLLTLQVMLVRYRQLALHRTLGLAGALMIPVLVVTGLGAEVFSQAFYVSRDPENLRFFILPVMTMVLFTVFAVLALVRRQDPAAHKRLILLATSMLLSAAYNRWLGDAVQSAVGLGFWGVYARFFCGPSLLMLAAAGYDLVSRGRVHPVLLWSIPAALAAELASSAIYHSSWWPGMARSILGL